jgi:hypothetical protein
MNITRASREMMCCGPPSLELAALLFLAQCDEIIITRDYKSSSLSTKSFDIHLVSHLKYESTNSSYYQRPKT